MSTYNLADLIGKTMIAKKKCVSNKLPDSSSGIFAEYETGDSIGKVYSYIKKGNKTWLMFDGNGKTYYFDLSQKNVIDKPELSNQGVLTTEEKKIIADEEAKDTLTKIYDKVFNLLLIFGAFLLVRAYIENK